MPWWRALAWFVRRCRTIRTIRENYEKETAWLGICAMIDHNPQAVVPVRGTRHGPWNHARAPACVYRSKRSRVPSARCANPYTRTRSELCVLLRRRGTLDHVHLGPRRPFSSRAWSANAQCPRARAGRLTWGVRRGAARRGVVWCGGPRSVAQILQGFKASVGPDHWAQYVASFPQHIQDGLVKYELQQN